MTRKGKWIYLETFYSICSLVLNNYINLNVANYFFPTLSTIFFVEIFLSYDPYLTSDHVLFALH